MRDLVDFEVLSSRDDCGSVEEGVLREKVRGLDGAAARRVGMKCWLEQVRGVDGPGKIWSGARSMVGISLGVMMFLLGIGAMTGMLDRERMAFHVPLVLGVSVGIPFLVLIFGGLTWVFRRKFSNGIGLLQRVLGKLVVRLGGSAQGELWQQMRLEGGKGWNALCWNLFRMTQGAAVMFSLGLMVGLLGCIWFLRVHFYWESTTPDWMANKIYEVCRVLSVPWAWAMPAWSPSLEVVQSARWGIEPPLVEDLNQAANWYPFLFVSIGFWGVMPRVILWFVAMKKERSALALLDFQSKRHRKLWRKMVGSRRVDLSEEPLDGVLVLDVGGTGLKEEEMRGYLLRKLRVNPSGWYEVGVWDERGEEAAEETIRKAPAGVVFLAEGWALAPPRMRALHRQVRNLSGPETQIYFFVVAADREGLPHDVSDEERRIWRDFVDELADASAEIHFYEEEAV
ncbi:MAG: DUF2868 domain-containing protein [Akkermansiaceae bacterium]